MRELLQPGDKILDSGGYLVTQHWGSGYNESCKTPYEMFQKALKGEVSFEGYASVANNHVQAELAYEYDVPLPEGATIVPPTIEEVRARATMFSADLYFNAMRHARQAAARAA